MRLEDIKKYLTLGRHDPVFLRDYDQILDELRYKRDRKEISDSEYRDLLDSFVSHKTGELREGIKKAFTHYHTISTRGFFAYKISEKELGLILKAREIVADFYSWTKVVRHMEDSPFVWEYLEDLSKELLRLLQEKENNKIWTIFYQLKNVASLTLSRKILRRNSRMDRIAKVVLHAMIYEQEYLSKHPIKTNNMDLFEDSFDVKSEGSKLFYHYLVNYGTFREEAKKSFDKISNMLKEGKIDKDTYNRYRSVLASHSYDLTDLGKVRDFEPILTYSYCKDRNEDPRNCYVYTQDEMTRAINFSRGFYKVFTKDFFLNEMLIRRLNTDLSTQAHDPRVKAEVGKVYFDSLNMLKNYGLIGTDEYATYREKGLVKFS